MEQPFSLAGKNALITGGAVGIGRGIALEMSRAGAQVAIAYHSSCEEAQIACREISALGVECLATGVDTADEVSVKGMVAQVMANWGRLDILVNNAGILSLGKQVDLPVNDFDRLMGVNIKGVFLCSRVAAREMMKSGGGAIINITSINALHPGFGGTAHYDASKGAVLAYTRSLAAELAPAKIRVNAIAPGLIDSAGLRRNAGELAAAVEARMPLKRLGNPRDIGLAAVYLASAAADWITGQTLVVDGGYLLT